jgi:hypothetical protein
MRILIVTDTPSVAEAYAKAHGFADYKWVFQLEDLEDEENVGVVFTGEHHSLTEWWPIRKRVEEMVRSGLAEWYY